MEPLTRFQPPVYPVGKAVTPAISKATLSNGVPVYFIESGTEDLTRIEFTFPAGQVKENRPLLASTVNMMLAEGSRNYTSEELHSKLDYFGAFLQMSVDKDRAGMVIFTLNRYFEKILEMGYEILFNPVFPEKEFIALMKKRLQWYRINREKVQNLASDQFFESVFGKDHPYGRQIVDADFEDLDITALKDYHSSFYSTGNMAIIISGRIPEAATMMLENIFGKMIEGSSPEPKLLELQNGELRKKIHIPKKGNIQTAIRIGSRSINKRNPDYFSLKVLDTILGGYFGSRLMKNIREDKGYTYGIRSYVSSLDLTGYKLITTDIGNENVQNAIKEIYKEISILQSDFVENQELETVRNYMAGEMLRMFDGPFATAESFRSAWEFGHDLGYYDKFSEKIRTIGADEIKAIAEKYYKIDDLYQVTAGSE